MTTALQYARALHEILKAHPKEENMYLKRTIATLRARGHERLLPQIYAEYKKLLLREEHKARSEHYAPEQERTRVLLELYQTLIHA